MAKAARAPPRARLVARRAPGRARRPGPAPGAELAQPVAHGAAAATCARAPRGLERRRARARGCAASADGVRAARAVRGAVGVALARDSAMRRRRRRSTSVASSRWPPVTTTARGPSAWTRARERLGRRASSPAPASTRASGDVGRDDGRARQESLAQRVARASSSSRRAAGLGDHHRVDHDRRAGGQQVERRGHGLDRLATSPSIPIFTASTPMSLGDGARPGRRSSPGETARPRRPRRCSAP